MREAAALLLLAVESLGLGDSVVGGGDGAGEGVALVVVLGALSHLGRDGEPHAVLAKVLRFLRVVAERGSVGHGRKARPEQAKAGQQGRRLRMESSGFGRCSTLSFSSSVTPVSRRKGKQSHHPQCHQQAKQPHGRGAAWQAQQANSKSAEDERVAIPLWSGSVITHAHTRSHHSKSDHKVSGTRKAEKTAEVKLTTLKGKTQEGQQEGCLAVFAQGCRAPRRP